jgi:hypothetical protein
MVKEKVLRIAEVPSTFIDPEVILPSMVSKGSSSIFNLVIRA